MTTNPRRSVMRHRSGGARGRVGPGRGRADSRIFRLAHAQPEPVDLAVRVRDGFRGWSQRAGGALVDAVGRCSAGATSQWAAAVATAGAVHEVVDAEAVHDAHPVRGPVGPVLVDPA